MTWVLDLGGGRRTRAVAEALGSSGPGMRLVRAPDADEPTGVLVCGANSPELRVALTAAGSADTRVIVVALADGSPEPWSVLADGAADLVVWADDPRPVLARLARLHEVERMIAAPPVSELILGSSPALRRALRDLVTAARYGTGPILILGETGTGKELAARVVHAVSAANRTGQLVVVDCTTIVPTLSGSELFGHERGAFTGAQSVRTGACAAANGGTLLLDEVGELPLDLQPELLRVVQEGTFKRVGADNWQHTDFRLVCATNRDLDAEVAAGRFRSDFFYRIAATTVRLPPLRERIEDIIPLFRAFFGQPDGVAAPVDLTAAVAVALCARDYPGNLRDLRQLAHRVAARHVGPGPVTPGDLPPADRPAPMHPTERPGTIDALTEPVRGLLRRGTTLKDLREQVAEVAVTIALQDAGGNVRAAAARLGITDRALHLRRAQQRVQRNGAVNSAASSA